MMSKGTLNGKISAFTEVIYIIGQLIRRKKKELHTMAPGVRAERNWLAVEASAPSCFTPQQSHHALPEAHQRAEGKAVITVGPLT